MIADLIKISLGDGTPHFDDFIGTSRGQHVVVVVVTDAVDWCGVSTQGGERLVDGCVTSLAVRLRPDVETVVLQCSDDQFVVFACETHRVPSDVRRRKSRSSKTNLSNYATHFVFLRNVPDHRRLFCFHRQQPSSLTVELGAIGDGA